MKKIIAIIAIILNIQATHCSNMSENSMPSTQLSQETQSTLKETITLGLSNLMSVFTLCFIGYKILCNRSSISHNNFFKNTSSNKPAWKRDSNGFYYPVLTQKVKTLN